MTVKDHTYLKRSFSTFVVLLLITVTHMRRGSPRTAKSSGNRASIVMGRVPNKLIVFVICFSSGVGLLRYVAGSGIFFTTVNGIMWRSSNVQGRCINTRILYLMLPYMPLKLEGSWRPSATLKLKVCSPGDNSRPRGSNSGRGVSLCS